MRTTGIVFGSVVLGALALPIESNALCIAPKTLNGVWLGNDGGTYRIREFRPLGKVKGPRHQVWWLGKSADGGQTFTNAFRGGRNGNVVTGEWSDVRGRGFGNLELILDIPSSGPVKGRISGFRKTRGDGFGASEWTPACDDTTSTPQ